MLHSLTAAIKGNVPSSNASSNWKCTFFTLLKSKSAMLPHLSFLLSYTPLDCSISPGIISGTSVIIFQNCLLRPCYKKIIFYFHYLPGGRFCLVPHLVLSHLLGFLVQPGGHERRSWSQNRTDVTTHNHPQCEHLWESWLQSLFAAEERKGHDSFQMILFRMSSAVPSKCPLPSVTSRSMAQAQIPTLFMP